MDHSVQLIKSEKGKDLLLVNWCKYRYLYRRRDGLARWRCTKRMCNANVETNRDRTTVVKVIGEHNHEMDPLSKIQRHCLREICKQKPNDGFSYNPKKIVMAELAKTNFNLKLNDLKGICKSMHYKRQKDESKFFEKIKSKHVPPTSA